MIAFITGVAGQDGAYLSELLLEKGYEVHGMKRRASSFNTQRIDHLYNNDKFHLHYGDLTDSGCLLRLIKQIQPDEIYNLAAQSHVKVSFDKPEYTMDSNATGVIRLLECIRNLEFQNKTKFYQASTSELFGQTKEHPQNESTRFQPSSPYAVSKLAAYWAVNNYRDAYGIFACNGILFNHESPLRGETFLTRKVTRAVARIILGLQDKLMVGNIESKRDWGHARDYVEGMWLMLQQDKPQNYVLATGVQTTVKDFIEKSFVYAQDLIKSKNKNFHWEGEGLDAKGFINDRCVVEVNPIYFRPTDVTNLIGDSTKAYNELGWKPKCNIYDIIEEMVESDMYNERLLSQRNQYLKI